ncbi:MAG: PAS domain S-box protein [Ignavibacteriales bacterium]
MPNKILFIESHAGSCNGLKSHMEELGYAVHPILINDRSDAEKIEKDSKDLIFAYVTDHSSKEYVESSEELASRLEIPVIYYYDKKDGSDILLSSGIHSSRVILSPVDLQQLNLRIKKILNQHPKKDQSRRVNDEYSILNSLGYGIITADLTGNVIRINPAAELITGYSRSEAIDHVINDILKPEDLSLDNDIRNILSREVSGHTVLICKDGSRKTVEYDHKFIYHHDGSATGSVISLKDVTQKLKKEKKESLKFEFAIQHSHEVIFMTDRNGVINYVNPQFEKFYGYSSEEVIGKTPRIIKSGLMTDEFYRKFWENLLSGKNIDEEIINKTSSANLVTVQQSTSPIYDQHENIAGYISIQRDITEKKQNDELLRRAFDKAEESDKLKTAFLNQMSHEIRTPLNSILGFMSLMEEELVNKGISDLVQYFDSINRSSLRLQRTIEDILAMSSIQIGNYYTSVTKINLESVLSLLLTDFRSLASEKNLEVEFQNKSKTATIDGDSYTIIQSFQHLIDNALKFTNNGKVEITIYDNDGAVCVDILDTGIGISREYMESLFKPFSQEEIGYNRRYDGNGLGLAITKEYLRLNHACIYVKSEKGKGSVFTVVFYQSGNNDETDLII